MDMNQIMVVVGRMLLVFTGVSSGLCLLITVLRAKAVRSTLFGIQLIHMAGAVVVLTLTFIKVIETEIYGANYSLASCQGFYISYYLAWAVFNAAVVIIALDTVLNFPQTLIVCIGAPTTVWVVSLIFAFVIQYEIADGPAIKKIDEWHTECILMMSGDPQSGQFKGFLATVHVMGDAIPSLLLLVALIKLCESYRSGNRDRDKVLPFVTMAVIYLALVCLTRFLTLAFILNNIRGFSYQAYLWTQLAFEYGKVIICIVWLALYPMLRKVFLCHEIDDTETVQPVEELQL